MEKSCPGKDGHPSRSVNFSEVNYLPELRPLQQRPRMPWLSRFDKVDPTGRASVYIQAGQYPTHVFSISTRYGPDSNLA